MSLTTPITGGTSVRTGLTVTLANATPLGAWSSTNTSVATVGASTGVVTGVAVGSCSIIYTVGSDSIAEAFTVYYTTITNGWDLIRIMPVFQGRLGWHQPNVAHPILSNANKSATAGRYYDRGVHKAVTVLNYYELQNEAGISDNDFNQLLQDEEQAGIMRLLNAVLNKPQLIEHKVNYTRIANNLQYIIPNTDQVCGYRMNIAPGDYAVNIESIGLLFDGDVTFNMYLFNDVILAPVYSKSVSAIANTQVRVQMDWVMHYINSHASGGNMGGVWYICYLQADLGNVHAIDEQLNMWTSSDILGAYPFQSDKVGTLDFNRKNASVNFRSYGFNFEFSSYRDYTQTIIQNVSLFDEARLLVMALAVIEGITFSTATNSTQRATQAMAEKFAPTLNGLSGAFNKNPYISDLKAQLDNQLTRINLVFSPQEMAMSVPIGGGDGNDWQYEGFDIRDMPARDLPTGVIV